MKIIVLDRGWVEYKVEDDTSMNNVMDTIKTLQELRPEADIYLDWNENAVLLDPTSLNKQAPAGHCLH